jgi:hypothetical protein
MKESFEHRCILCSIMGLRNNLQSLEALRKKATSLFDVLGVGEDFAFLVR